MTVAIRLINAAFHQVDRQTWLTNSIAINQAEDGIKAVADNRWKQMVVWAIEQGSMEGAEAFFKGLFKDVEASILTQFYGGRSRDQLSPENKADFNSKSAWFRSNRSVIKRAYEVGVDLLDGISFPKGKSQVEREISDKVKAENEAGGKTELEKFVAVMATANAIAGKIEDAAEKRTALGLVANLARVLKVGEEE